MPTVSLLAAPGPEPTINGITPKMVERLVISIGLSLIVEASTIASSNFFPSFLNWLVNSTIKIPKNDAYRQYLAYYKGWGDYKNYKKDKKAIIYAKSVKDLANDYRKQLTMCQKNLDKNKYIIF